MKPTVVLGQAIDFIKAARATSPRPAFSIVPQVITSSIVIFALVVGLGGWAATANIAGAIIAPGTFVVDKNVKKVQHSFGGIVSAINVKNGDRVAAGDVLLRLDSTQTGAELGIIKAQNIELTARSLRLTAQRDGKDSLIFPEALIQQSPEAKAAADGEARLFTEAAKARESQKEQLLLKVKQAEEEIVGLTVQREAKANEMRIISKELEDLRGLQRKQLAPASRIYGMEREAARLSGEHGGLTSQIARAHSQISEIRVQIISLAEGLRAQAQGELRSIEGKLSELYERDIAASDKLRRVDIRAPQSGIVHELSVHTIGGVITPAEQIMLIVPEEEALAIQARVSSNDIDQVVVGRPARLLLSAFSKEKTPELNGYVTDVAPDVTVDPKTGQSYYVARLEMDEKARRTVDNLKLMAGMPIEIHLSTGDRTALSYIAKPFTDQISRAFRE
jgi:HlyD family secretion protein